MSEVPIIMICCTLTLLTSDLSGWTPLHEACNYGHIQVATLLLRQCANINARGMDGDTPLHDAAINGHMEVSSQQEKGLKHVHHEAGYDTNYDIVCLHCMGTRKCIHFMLKLIMLHTYIHTYTHTYIHTYIHTYQGFIQDFLFEGVDEHL